MLEHRVLALLLLLLLLVFRHPLLDVFLHLLHLVLKCRFLHLVDVLETAILGHYDSLLLLLVRGLALRQEGLRFLEEGLLLSAVIGGFRLINFLTSIVVAVLLLLAVLELHIIELLAQPHLIRDWLVKVEFIIIFLIYILDLDDHMLYHILLVRVQLDDLAVVYAEQALQVVHRALAHYGRLEAEVVLVQKYLTAEWQRPRCALFYRWNAQKHFYGTAVDRLYQVLFRFIDTIRLASCKA